MPLRPLPLKSIPSSLIYPLNRPNSSSLLKPRAPDPIQSLLQSQSPPQSEPSSSTHSNSSTPSNSTSTPLPLPSNLRLQEWMEDDRKRWEGIKRDVRDGVEKGKRVRVGLKTLLRER